MIKATTPTHSFTFPEEIRNYEKVLVTYSQRGKVVLEKTKDDFLIYDESPNTGMITLTQEETNLFDRLVNAEVQIRAKDLGGNVSASKMMTIFVNPVLNEEIL